jgi:hypothetical protein
MRAILIFGMGVLVGFVLAYLVDNDAAQKPFEAALASYNSCYQHVDDGPQCEPLRQIMNATAVAAGRR